jgi:hypothetical protein
MKLLSLLGLLSSILFFLNGGGLSLGSHGNAITVPDIIELPGGTYGNRYPVKQGKNSL